MGRGGFRRLVVAAACLGALAARADDAEIISLVGKGDARETADAPWRPAAVKQKLLAGAFVRTGEMSQMALLLRDRTQVRLNQLSILNIKAVNSGEPPPPTRLELPRGRAWSQARPRGAPVAAGAKPPRLEVSMPGGTASIRGTDWELVVDPDGTSTVTVVSGEIEFGNEHGRVLLQPNEQGRAVPGQAPVKTLLTSAADRVQWVTAYRPQPRRWVKDFSGGLEAAARAIEAQDYAPALRALETMKDARASLLLADLKLFFGQAGEAIALLRAHEDEPMAAALLARAHMIAGDLAQAAAALEPAAARHPRHAELLLARAELARLQGDEPAARRALAALLEAEPRNPEAWYLLGRIETEREYVAAARAALKRALAARPDGAGYQGELATLETFANDFAAAEAAFQDALARQPDDYVALTGLGILQMKRGASEAALESFLKAGAMEPRYARAWLFAGVAHYQLGERERALQAFGRAAALDDKDPLPHLVRSLVYYDALELGAAIDAAREAQSRLPYLKSLNQVLSDQKGNANLGSALAAFGLEEWSQAYAYDFYSPYWAGSHLFLADRFAGSYNRNSELFKGFLSDPAVFGASNRFSSVIPVPGRYATFEAGLARDYIDEARVGATFNGYSDAPGPLAWLAGGDYTRGDSGINRTDADGRMRASGANLVLGLGARPAHELGLFGFVTRSNYSGRIAERLSGLTGDEFSYDYGRHDFGVNLKFSPVSQGWLKLGEGSEQVPLSGALVSQDTADTLNRVFGTTVFQPEGRLDAFRSEASQRDLQWRHTFDAAPGAQVSWGFEYAEERKPLAMDMAFAPLRITLDQENRVKSVGAYVSGRYALSASLEAQLDLHLQDTKSAFTTEQAVALGTLVVPLPSDAGGTRHREVNPRIGVRWRPAAGHTLRAAAQGWRRPAGVNTLAPVDTVGIALDDRVERVGGKLERARVQHEIELGRRTFFEWFVDVKRVRNLADAGSGIVPGLELEQLEKLRVRRRVYASRSDYFEDQPDFGAGHIDSAGGALNLLLSPRVSAAARYVYAETRNTTEEFRGRRLPFHPRHYVNLALNWQPYARWIVGPAATWRSGRYADEENAEPLSAGWSFGLNAYWESEDKRWSVGLLVDHLASDRQSSIYRHAMTQLQASYRF